jgi:hypothetical protein
MILRGRRILADQMEFLLAGVPRNSRLRAQPQHPQRPASGRGGA